MKSKRLQLFACMSLAALFTVGCSTDIKEEDYRFSNDEGKKVTFSAVINDQTSNDMKPNTRATETSWVVGDLVGITCGDRQVNVQYQYSGDANNYFTAVNNRKEIWLMGTETYDVSAYWPFSGTEGKAQAPQAICTSSEANATAETRNQFDYLYASGTATRENPNVQLAFSHVMSRIELKFVPGDLPKLDDIDCYVTGIKLNGTFNPNTGATTVDEQVDGQPQAIGSINQVLTDNNSHTFTALVIPQTLEEGLLIEAGMNGIYYQVKVDLTELKTGYSYNYTVTANDYNDNPIKLTITGTEIKPWTNVDGGTLDPDPSLSGTEAETDPTDWGKLDDEDVIPSEAE